MSDTPYAQPYMPMQCQKLHVARQKVPITMAASPLGVTSSLNWGKRNRRALKRVFLSAGGRQSPASAGRRELPWRVQPGCTSPKTVAPLCPPSVNPWQRVGCRHHTDTRHVIKMRTLLWWALFKHVAAHRPCCKGPEAPCLTRHRGFRPAC